MAKAPATYPAICKFLGHGFSSFDIGRLDGSGGFLAIPRDSLKSSHPLRDTTVRRRIVLPLLGVGAAGAAVASLACCCVTGFRSPLRGIASGTERLVAIDSMATKHYGLAFVAVSVSCLLFVLGTNGQEFSFVFVCN